MPVQRIDSFTSGEGRASFAFWGAPVIFDATGELSCPGFDGNTYANNPWDYVQIPATKHGVTPGICEVTCHRYRDLDKKKAKGNDGARLTLHGLEPAQIEISITIWTPQQLKDLADIWKEIFINSAVDSKGKSKIQSFDVNHQIFDLQGVKSIVFQGGEGPNPGRTVKTRTFVIRAIEFIEQKKQQKKSETPSEALATVADFQFGVSFQQTGKNPANVGPQ